MPDDSTPRQSDAPAPPPGLPGANPHGPLGGIDTWMAQNPWHPRLTPFLIYILLLPVIGLLHTDIKWIGVPIERAPITYPILYGLQCALVAYLLWRYRRLTPELTIRFHWLAVPVGGFVFIAWVWLGMLIAEFDRVREVGITAFTSELTQWTLTPDSAPHRYDNDPDVESFFEQMGVTTAWVAFSMRLAGMALLVPLFEELFIRSLMLRSFADGKRTTRGLIQVLTDVPLLGDALMHSRVGRWASSPPVLFGQEFVRTPLGKLTVSGVIVSTLVFMVHHAVRDYPGTVICGLAYCGLLAATRHKGLGPVAWAHGITNALLWAYTLHTGDWRFL